MGQVGDGNSEGRGHGSILDKHRNLGCRRIWRSAKRGRSGISATPTDDPELRCSQNIIRLIIGGLGLSLAPLLCLFHGSTELSISDFYDTNRRDYFEGVLCCLAVALFAYSPYGKEGRNDAWIATVGAVCASLVALFPTTNDTLKRVPALLVLRWLPVTCSAVIHQDKHARHSSDEYDALPRSSSARARTPELPAPRTAGRGPEGASRRATSRAPPPPAQAIGA